MRSDHSRAFITFCTSAKVTPELFNELNESSFNDSPIEELFKPMFYNEFTPAERDPKALPASSKERVEFTVDEPFEEFSATELQDFFMERYKPFEQQNDSIGDEIFAVLDERSTRDLTIVCYANQRFLDEEGEEELYSQWYSWRVVFAEAYTMARLLLTASPELIDDILIAQQSHFTKDDGIFDMQRALRDGVNGQILNATRKRL